jgi:hypothetical protein
MDEHAVSESLADDELWSFMWYMMVAILGNFRY